MYEVCETRTQHDHKGVDMSLIGKIRHRSHRSTSALRELSRAAAAAPTRASRDELLLLKNMGR